MEYLKLSRNDNPTDAPVVEDPTVEQSATEEVELVNPAVEDTTTVDPKIEEDNNEVEKP